MGTNEGGGAADRQSEMQASCIWCDRLHPVETLLAFNPVCPACASSRRAGPVGPGRLELPSS